MASADGSRESDNGGRRSLATSRSGIDVNLRVGYNGVTVSRRRRVIREEGWIESVRGLVASNLLAVNNGQTDS